MWQSYNTDSPTSVMEITDGTGSDRFGSSIAVGTSKIVVGARLRDPNGSNSGSVYIYNIDGTGKIEIDASDGVAGAEFGTSVAIDEKSGKIVVGAPFHPGGGQAYIYNLDGTGEVILSPSELQTGDHFGYCVGINNNKVYVSAAQYSHINDDEGAMFMFNTDGTNKKFVLSPEGVGSYRKFGNTFEVSCDRVVVGENGLKGSGSTTGYTFHIFDLHLNHIKTYSSGGLSSSWAPAGKWLAVGSGRIIVGNYTARVGGVFATGEVYIHNLNGDLIDIIYSPRSGQSSFFGFSVGVDSGKIFVSAMENENPGGGNYVYMFDLDGKFISDINEGSTHDRLGVEFGIECSNGKLLLSHEEQNKVFVYHYTPAYTPFDVRDLEKGNK
jgi:hypothetical protein